MRILTYTRFHKLPKAFERKLENLPKNIQTRLNPPLKLEFDAKIGQTLKGDLSAAHRVSFGADRAEAGLGIFRAAGLPCIDPRVPPQISEVRFVLDLEGCEAELGGVKQLLEQF